MLYVVLDLVTVAGHVRVEDGDRASNRRITVGSRSRLRTAKAAAVQQSLGLGSLTPQLPL